MGRAFVGIEAKRSNFISAAHYISTTIAHCAETYVGRHGLKMAYPKMTVTDLK